MGCGRGCWIVCVRCVICLDVDTGVWVDVDTGVWVDVDTGVWVDVVYLGLGAVAVADIAVLLLYTDVRPTKSPVSKSVEFRNVRRFNQNTN